MHRARKRFGQHFLHDRAIIDRIINAIGPRAGERLIEIGPGLGAITLPLLDRIGTLEAVEIDRDAARHLRDIAPAHGTLRLHEADILEFDFRTLAAPGERLRLAGNLPYNISTPLLFHLIEQRAVLADMHFMLQKEVVARMAARANDDDYGRLSVMLAPWLAVEPLFDIGPGAFRPPPRVTSTFVRLLPHATPPFALGDPRKFAKVVAAAFSQRRKTLRVVRVRSPGRRSRARGPGTASSTHYGHTERVFELRRRARPFTASPSVRRRVGAGIRSHARFRHIGQVGSAPAMLIPYPHAVQRNCAVPRWCVGRTPHLHLRTDKASAFARTLFALECRPTLAVEWHSSA